MPVYLNHKRYFILGSILAGCLFALSLWHRWIHIDDAWLGEQVYWLVRDGHVRSELFRGFMDHEDKLFVWHKLYIWQGALLTKLFGFNVYLLKSLSLVYLGLLIFIFKKLFDFYEIKKDLFWLGLVLILTSNLVFELGFTFRPDLAVTSFGLISFYFLRCKQDRQLLAGMFAGLAAACHLNGILFIGAGGILLLLRKDIRGALIFSLAAGMMSLFYFHDVSSWMEFKTLLSQFKNDPSVSHEFAGPFHYVWKLIDEQRRYLHSPLEIAYTLLLLVFAVPHLKSLYKKDRELFTYISSISILLALLSHGKTSKYLIYTQPLFFLVMLMYWPEKLRFSKKAVLAVCLVFYSYLNIKTYVLRNYDEVKAMEQVASDIPKDAKIVAHLDFIFNQIERYQIQGTQVYEFFISQGKLKQDADSFFKMAANFDRDYVLLNPEAMSYYNVKDQNYEGYQFIKKESLLGYTLFKRSSRQPTNQQN